MSLENLFNNYNLISCNLVHVIDGDIIQHNKYKFSLKHTPDVDDPPKHTFEKILVDLQDFKVILGMAGDPDP